MDEIPEVIRICPNGSGAFFIFFNLPDGRLTFWTISNDQDVEDELGAWSKFKKQWYSEVYKWRRECGIKEYNVEKAQELWDFFEGKL